MSLFDDIKEVALSTVEFIPVVGSMYYLSQAAVASVEHDSLNLWTSVTKHYEGLIRDVFMFTEVEEPATVAIVHAMIESGSEKIIEVVHRGESSKESETKRETYILAPNKGKSDKEIFTDKVKGVHHFHGAIFTGELNLWKHREYTNDGKGVEIRLEIPHGLYDGAQVTFSWKWTVDANGNPNRPEMTRGIIQLEADTPTKFKLWKREGANGWEGYNFECEIISEDHILAKTKGMAGNDITTIKFKRDPPTYTSVDEFF